jgi:hypothetical protein
MPAEAGTHDTGQRSAWISGVIAVRPMRGQGAICGERVQADAGVHPRPSAVAVAPRRLPGLTLVPGVPVEVSDIARVMLMRRTWW